VDESMRRLGNVGRSRSSARRPISTSAKGRHPDQRGEGTSRFQALIRPVYDSVESKVGKEFMGGCTPSPPPESSAPSPVIHRALANLVEESSS
jgi:hypothetical protein